MCIHTVYGCVCCDVSVEVRRQLKGILGAK